METSKTLAGLIGPAFVAVAASMLLNLDSLPAVIGQASSDAALILTAGVITFVAGLSIVRVHNRWSGGWPVVVTVLGWLFVLGGLVRILFPVQLGPAMSALGEETWFLVGEAVILLLVGGFLSLKAYSQA
jgi:hypothetical protein